MGAGNLKVYAGGSKAIGSVALTEQAKRVKLKYKYAYCGM